MIGRLLCLFGVHDQHSWTEDNGFAAAPVGHPCRPESGDGAAVVIAKFARWTRLRCRRCGWTYPR